MSKYTVLFNGFAVCHIDDPAIADGIENIEVVPYSKSHPPLEINGVRQDKPKNDTWLDEYNFVD